MERKILFHLTSLDTSADMAVLCSIHVLSWWFHAFFHSPLQLLLLPFVLLWVSERQLLFLGCLSGTSVDIGSLDLIFFDLKPILKPIKNLSHLSCGVPTPAWFPGAQTYLGKGSKVPKYLPALGLRFVLAVPPLRVLRLHTAAGAHGQAPARKRDLGAPCVPARVVRNSLPEAAGFWEASGTGKLQSCYFSLPTPVDISVQVPIAGLGYHWPTGATGIRSHHGDLQWSMRDMGRICYPLALGKPSP